jgi:hypothetical protein
MTDSDDYPPRKKIKFSSTVIDDVKFEREMDRFYKQFISDISHSVKHCIPLNKVASAQGATTTSPTSNSPSYENTKSTDSEAIHPWSAPTYLKESMLGDSIFMVLKEQLKHVSSVSIGYNGWSESFSKSRRGILPIILYWIDPVTFLRKTYVIDFSFEIPKIGHKRKAWLDVDVMKDLVKNIVVVMHKLDTLHKLTFVTGDHGDFDSIMGEIISTTCQLKSEHLSVPSDSEPILSFLQSCFYGNCPVYVMYTELVDLEKIIERIAPMSEGAKTFGSFKVIDRIAESISLQGSIRNRWFEICQKEGLPLRFLRSERTRWTTFAEQICCARRYMNVIDTMNGENEFGPTISEAFWEFLGYIAPILEIYIIFIDAVYSKSTLQARNIVTYYSMTMALEEQMSLFAISMSKTKNPFMNDFWKQASPIITKNIKVCVEKSLRNPLDLLKLLLVPSNYSLLQNKRTKFYTWLGLGKKYREFKNLAIKSLLAEVILRIALDYSKLALYEKREPSTTLVADTLRYRFRAEFDQFVYECLNLPHPQLSYSYTRHYGHKIKFDELPLNVEKRVYKRTMKFWESHRDKYPILTRFVVCILALPASNAHVQELIDITSVNVTPDFNPGYLRNIGLVRNVVNFDSSTRELVKKKLKEFARDEHYKQTLQLLVCRASS